MRPPGEVSGREVRGTSVVTSTVRQLSTRFPQSDAPMKLRLQASLLNGTTYGVAGEDVSKRRLGCMKKANQMVFPYAPAPPGA